MSKVSPYEVTTEELADPKTGIYIDERRMQRVAFAFVGAKFREIGRCSMSLPDDQAAYWEREIWKSDSLTS